ncbi:MAG: hypothetical protein N3G18_03270 [Candidatus Saccharicenans sp.]|nr:hypothetical protein [Candidatus Saccharicenans sp.]
MTPRERVWLALNHQEPDRCPLHLSFTPEFADRLRPSLGLGPEAHNPHGRGNSYLLERLTGCDLLLTSVGWANSYYATRSYSQDGLTYVDEWGVGWKNVEYETRFGRGRYTEIVSHPLAEDRAVDSYRAPDPDRPELYAEARWTVERFGAEYWIVGVVVTTIFETAWALRGLERTLLDMVRNPELVDRLFDIPFKYHLRVAKNLAGLGVDMIWLGDDVGAQDRMLISPGHWRRFLKPRLAEMIATLKRINPALKIAYHSDGNIYPIIPDLIEIGLDVLNPVQPRSMDPARLKKEFGDRLCFWGTMDLQYTLPFGTPDEVRDEVLERLRTVGRRGGLIIGPTHHLQLDVPLENFWAMVGTVRNTCYRDLK